MKPKALKFPFKWEARQPTLHEGVLFVPHHYDKHGEWTCPPLFEREAKVFVEYCSGNGDWIVNRAMQAPEANWIAVEKRFDRVRKIWSKMRNAGVKNLLIVCGEALTFSRFYLRDLSVDGTFVNFPDPWPKQRQAKHRLIQGPFVSELARIVKEDGSAVFATDDAPYRDQMIAEMHKHANWHSQHRAQWDDYGSSWFERLWKDKGREIFYLDFRKR